jgi:hypothetical protein
MLDKRKEIRVLSACVALTIILSIFTGYAFSTITVSISIPNSGQITTSGIVNAASGAPADIQSAISSLGPSGGTVFIPAGTFHWNGQTVTIPPGVNIVGSGLAGCADHTSSWASYTPQTVLVNDAAPTASYAYPDMFYIDGRSAQKYASVRISGIKFVATAPSSPANENANSGAAIDVRENYNFRIDHCTFLNFCNVAVAITANDGGNSSATAYGVVDHNVFDNPYKLSGSNWVWGYGIIVIGNIRYTSSGTVEDGYSMWDTDVQHFFGQYGPVAGFTIAYIEDNHFSNSRHAISSTAGGYYVARYNLFDTPACIYTVGTMDAHGAAFPSGRGFEAYSNTIIGARNNLSPWNSTYNSLAFQIRGGSCLVFDNTFINNKANANSFFLMMNANDYVSYLPFMNIMNTYIFNNSYTNCTFSTVDSSIVQNSQYFLRAPTQAQDGFSYAPYTYPHPRTLS